MQFRNSKCGSDACASNAVCNRRVLLRNEIGILHGIRHEIWFSITEKFKSTISQMISIYKSWKWIVRIRSWTLHFMYPSQFDTEKNCFKSACKSSQPLKTWFEMSRKNFNGILIWKEKKIHTLLLQQNLQITSISFFWFIQEMIFRLSPLLYTVLDCTLWFLDFCTLSINVQYRVWCLRYFTWLSYYTSDDYKLIKCKYLPSVVIEQWLEW